MQYDALSYSPFDVLNYFLSSLLVSSVSTGLPSSFYFKTCCSNSSTLVG